MKMAKSLIYWSIVTHFCCASLVSVEAAQTEDSKRLEFLENEALSRDWNRSNNAMQELVEKKQLHSMHEIFWLLEPNLRQSAARYLTLSGNTNLQVDWLLLQYYKSTNVPIPSKYHESVAARDGGTHRCLKYLSEKYDVPFVDYQSHQATLRQVSEIIAKLEPVFYRKFDERNQKTVTAVVNEAQPDPKAEIEDNGTMAPVPVTASSPPPASNPLMSTNNWLPTLTAVSILLNIILAGVNIKQRRSMSS